LRWFFLKQRKKKFETDFFTTMRKDKDSTAATRAKTKFLKRK
jgi:hypothetical protein